VNFIVKAIATGLGTGLCPVAPGSVGTLLGIPIYLVLAGCHWLVFLSGIVLISAIAVYASGAFETASGQKDPGRIVIDEIAGFQVALFLVAPTVWHVIAGYALFRFFDIVKLYPANLCETKLPGGYAVVMDDIIAGIYANIVLRIAILLWGI
jgi:phosphatidylglycerophosphatase A